jgi:multidrug resistance efflux pump/GAF domain-containing protein
VGAADSTATATPALGVGAIAAPADSLHAITLDLFASDDPGEVAGKALLAVRQIVAADTVSLWIPGDDECECRGAIGEQREFLSEKRVTISALTHALDGEGGVAVVTAGIAPNGGLSAILRATRPIDRDGRFTDAEQELIRALADAGAAAIANAARLEASAQSSAQRGDDLALVTEMSREITSTLDLDRVLRTVVNLASRAVKFDRGAVALYEKGTCDIRAVAGVDGIDPKDPRLQDLAVRAAWAAGIGESFYLSDRDDPASDAERTFVQIFGEDLQRDSVASGLYLPLRDEEGIVGILLFEANRVEFVGAREQNLAGILANQATVAVRNARLYHQVPLVEALGALSARKDAFFALPRRRRIAYAWIIVAVVAASTLIRWPMRVAGADPVFRPLSRAGVRPIVPGVVDRVFVREGMAVERGAPVAHLRDEELRARRDAAASEAAAADRSAALASSRGDAADERLQRLRATALRREYDLLDEQLRSMTLRAPVSGIVLTSRPEERVGARLDAGDSLVILGRTDSLELEFGVPERDITRIRPGDEVRLRITALPQRTFRGRVRTIGELPSDVGGERVFPVLAVAPNDEGLLRPGMAAYARVLTEPASALWRVARGPLRSIRLLWWRIWS